MSTVPTEDLNLLSRIKANDRLAFNRLFLKYHVGLLRFGKSLLAKDPERAEDVVQEVFLSVWKNRESLSIHTSFSAFLFTAVKNRIKDVYREQQWTLYDPTETAFDDALAANQEPDHLLMFKELNADINQMISLLPEKTKLVFRMNREDHLSYEQIAELLNISIHSVKTHMYRSIKFLKKSYSEYKSRH